MQVNLTASLSFVLSSMVCQLFQVIIKIPLLGVVILPRSKRAVYLVVPYPRHDILNHFPQRARCALLSVLLAQQVLVDACAQSGISPIEYHSLWLWTQQPVAHTFVSSSIHMRWVLYRLDDLRNKSCHDDHRINLS